MFIASWREKANCLIHFSMSKRFHFVDGCPVDIQVSEPEGTGCPKTR